MISGEAKILGGAAMNDGDATAGGEDRKARISDWWFCIVPVVAAIIGYATVLPQRPLLDEQFLFAWVSHSAESSSMNTFFAWPGFETFDHWGPATHTLLAAAGSIFSSATIVFRIFSLLLHCGSSALVFALGRALRFPPLLCAAAGVIFALYPLSCNAVGWAGAVAAILGGFLALASLTLYCHLRRQGLNWVLLAAALVCYAGAMAASFNYWFVPLMAVWLELASLPFRNTDGDAAQKRDFTQVVIPLLLFSMISAVFVAAGGLNSLNAPEFGGNNASYLFRDLFMPINQSLVQRYSKEYVSAYILGASLAVPLVVSLWKLPLARTGVLTAAGWLAIAALPFCGVVMTSTGFYGAHWMYLAAMPVAFLLAIASSGIASAFNRLRFFIQIPLAVLLTLWISVFFFRNLQVCNHSSKEQAKQLSRVQKSIRIANEKLNRPFLVLRDLPPKLSVAPNFSPQGPACFDTQTGLLRSGEVPSGHLKDLLREGRLNDVTLRWENNLASFLPLDLTPTKASWLVGMKPEDIAYRLEPALPFYKTVSIDQQSQCLILETNSQNGPIITMTACELSPTDGDYLCVDARIECPPSVVSPSIELHWQTKVHPTYERTERFTYTRAHVNDQQFHQYMLSLRRNGWTTGGPPQFISFGFPAGAKVWLKNITLERGTARSAQLLSSQTSAVATERTRFNPPCYNFPTDADLRMIALPHGATTISAKYSVENIPESAGVLVEVSKPNQSFDEANSDHLSSVTYRTYSLKGKAGSIEIPVSELNGPGAYSIRVIGTDEHNSYCGMFSDATVFFVPFVSN